MNTIKWWFLGFRNGWWKPTPLGYWVLQNTVDSATLAYYRGFIFAARLRGVRSEL